MANKNDISDLVEFSFFTIIIISGFFALCGYGYRVVEKKYVPSISAKVSSYPGYIQRYFEIAKD